MLQTMGVTKSCIQQNNKLNADFTLILKITNKSEKSHIISLCIIDIITLKNWCQIVSSLSKTT